MPVRIFTYLIGGDSSSRSNMHTIACSNKGFYAQVNSAEDARLQVINYALVMARPMVLYQAEHPIHWSPVFLGGPSTSLGVDSEQQRRLVTTVSTPVYDRRNHSVRVANLLGVVGTDVPIEDIKKMVPQYKVSGYSGRWLRSRTLADCFALFVAARRERLLVHCGQQWTRSVPSGLACPGECLKIECECLSYSEIIQSTVRTC